MKYALIINKGTDNVGDDIQSMAAIRFLPQVDYLIDREALDLFCPDDGPDERVLTIMNGWFLYNKFNWPPSPFLHPLLLSMHFSPNDIYHIGAKFLEGIGGDYLRQHGPVGARDEHTLKLLQSMDIPCYQSGCMTLTLPRYEGIEPGEAAILVDLEQEQEQLLRDRYPNCSFETATHYADYFRETSGTTSWEERQTRAEELLKRYQGARCVVTSRLHCALPCLALGVPVLMIYREEYAPRVASFLPLLHHCTDTELQNGTEQFDISNPPRNKEAYLPIREELIKCCEAFVRQPGVEVEQLPDVELFKRYWLKTAAWQKHLLMNFEQHFRQDVETQHSWVGQLEQSKEFLQQQVQNKDQRIQELDGWIQELSTTKDYLDAQVKTKDARIAELDGWIQELSAAKDYLDAQVKTKDARIAELDAWIAQLEEDKVYLEQQIQTKDARISELEHWSDELQSAKDYVDSQHTQTQQVNQQLRQDLDQAEQSVSKLRFKLNLLLGDAKVQKIIQKKKYEI